MSSINLVLRVLATLFALFHCSSALEHPISMSAGAYEWKVQGMLILVCFLVLHAGQGDAGPAALSAIGRKAWGHLARWCYGHYRWGTVSPGVGPVGWWCKSRFCWCWHCWQVPPPLPWVGKTPTNCCCGWWTYLCPSVDQMWVSAILLHFWNFVWRKSQAHAYRTLEIINIISNNRNQNIVVQRWGGWGGGGDAGYWDMHCLERGIKELSGMMECSISSLGSWLYGCIICQDFQKYL